MGGNTDNPGNIAEAELSTLEARLQKHVGDETTLAEIVAAMRTIVDADASAAAEIRNFVKNRYQSGRLRRESLELVESLLERMTADAMNDPANPDADEEKPYTSTTVLDADESPAADGAIQLQVGTLLRDRFLLKQEIAGGSMGTVFKALDRRLAEAGDENAFVAIKVLSAKLARNGNALRALQQEAAKGRCLAHPNIVRFIDLDRESDTYFIVMEWLEGRSLASILDEMAGGAMEIDAAMDIVRQLAKALDYAHERGVVHADVKPGNVMVTRDGAVKLIDFGIARVRQEQIAGKAKFDPAVLSAGTPAYSSMQVLTGEAPVPADDVFSLACLFYRLVAGYRVFGPRDAAAAAEQGMEPQRPQGIGDRQWQALKKALSYSRVTRFATPSEFIDAMSGDAADIVISAPPRNLDVDEAPRRSPWRAAVVVAIILGSIAVVTQTNFVDRVGDLVASQSSDSPGPVNPSEGATDQAEDIERMGGVDEPTPMAGSEDAPPDGSAVERPREPMERSPAEIIDQPDLATAGDPPVNETTHSPIASTDSEPLATEDGELSAAYLADRADSETPVADLIPDSTAASVPVDLQTRNVAAAEFDFTAPPPDLVLEIGAPNPDVEPPLLPLVMREGDRDSIVDLIRTANIGESATYAILEDRFDGTVSPLETGQYSIAGGGEVVFAAGQARARTSLSVRSDPVREQDQEITLTVHSLDNLNLALARLQLTIEDDDQRNFEASLQPDTVAFAVNQIAVREADSAVQIDVIRYKATNTPLEVSYTVNDVTARQNEDYFSPALTVVYFNAGQRTARILIPLVQDSALERDEAFMLQLEGPNASDDSNIYSQIAVMIRDDDS